LAMSSRNLRLNASERKNAGQIFKTLEFVKNNINNQNFEALKLSATKQLEASGFKVDYVEIANVKDLSVAENKTEALVALSAATLNNIRLIDNILLN
ncbi:MAG: pantoate--beta-alanine ligase, partial [Bacteroidota bacterium]